MKGQRLVYKFRNLPYKYEPGITRSVYRDRFQTINTSLCNQEPGIIKDLLPLKFNSSPSVSRAFFSSSLPPRGSSPWTTSPRASSEGCTCLDVGLSLSSIFCSKTRIYFPMREGHSKTTERWQAGTRLESVIHWRAYNIKKKSCKLLINLCLIRTKKSEKSYSLYTHLVHDMIINTTGN